MFAMFFGAGNVVFPLTLGREALDQNLFAIIGLLISAVCVPFIGLIAMILFNGDSKAFFGRLGKTPGFLITIIIMALIGPFGATPRCIALSYATITMFAPGIPLTLFSAAACLIILFFTVRPSTILEVLGYLLTPFLLLALGIIVVKGLWAAPEMLHSPAAPLETFFNGFTVGYQTMDLLGAFFFSAVVIECLVEERHATQPRDYKKLTRMALKASGIGAFLLGAIYFGFSYVSAYYGNSFLEIEKGRLLGAIALEVLGPYAGIIASAAVALACLTTAIALVTVFTEFIQRDVAQNKIGYIPCLLGTLAVTFLISTLDFTGIITFLKPILEVCYPALIALSLLNLAYKLYGFEPVKWPVFAIFGISLAAKLLF